MSVTPWSSQIASEFVINNPWSTSASGGREVPSLRDTLTLFPSRLGTLATRNPKDCSRTLQLTCHLLPRYRLLRAMTLASPEQANIHQESARRPRATITSRVGSSRGSEQILRLIRDRGIEAGTDTYGPRPSGQSSACMLPSSQIALLAASHR